MTVCIRIYVCIYNTRECNHEFYLRLQKYTCGAHAVIKMESERWRLMERMELYIMSQKLYTEQITWLQYKFNHDKIYLDRKDRIAHSR